MTTTVEPTVAANRELALEAAGAIGWQQAIAVLVSATTDLLRAVHEFPAEYREVADADLKLAATVEEQLLVLRAELQAYGDGIEPIGDEPPRQAAMLLRSLLEIALGTSIPLPEDVAHVPSTTADLAPATEAVAGRGAASEKKLTWTVRNLTAKELELQACDGGKLVLPAFGYRTLVTDPHVELELDDELAQGEIEVSEPRMESAPQYDVFFGIYFWLAVGAIFAGVYWGPWGWILAAFILIVPGLGFFVAAKGERRERLKAFAAELPTRLLQFLNFLIVLFVGVVIPAAVIVFGADLRDVVSDVAGLDASASEYLTLVCRGMQLVLISIASLLPALLYYQFDRDRLSTLREKFVHQIFRLDSSMKTLGAIDAKYGRLIDEIYGPARSGRYRKLLPGRRAPILVATLLIMLGWLLVLLNPDVQLITDESEIAELFDPRQTAPAFAFLGAYFFTLFALLRGYVRRDLRPKSYSDISVRIITVVILAWVLELIFVDDSNALLVFAFLVGIVPQAALNVIREFTQGRLSRRARRRRDQPAGGSGSDDTVAAALADPLPLTNLEGIDLYDRTRLASEGVTNIEALAHHDLVELMLQTRIPVPRLVDWTDQAILHLHVGPDDRATLSTFGIRTASDLLHARDCAEGRGGQPKLEEFIGLLGGPKEGPRRMQVILDSIEDEEWMASIRNWHNREP